MDTIISASTNLKSPPISSSLNGVDFKQFKRNHNGLMLNHVVGLSGAKDHKSLSHTNFYLTPNVVLSSILNSTDGVLKSTSVETHIKYGSTYLTFSPKRKYTEKYGLGIFTNPQTPTIFKIDLYPNNQCRISTIYDNLKYFLCCDEGGLLYFGLERKLDVVEGSFNSIDFQYMFSEETDQILLFKPTPTESLFLTNTRGNLVTIPIIDNNITTYILQPFSLDRGLYTDSTPPIDSSFITYTDSNTIDQNDSLFGMANNFLLHRPIVNIDNTNIIVLKNQLCEYDTFIPNNNLRVNSKPQSAIFVDDGTREYSSINQDIKTEESQNLNLSYATNTVSYRIYPGNNKFVSPTSMFPFMKLNINDSNLVNCGAFAYPTPEFSDKVYAPATNTQNVKYNQPLLCTWLSGNIGGDGAIWLDRYYYPDLIEREDAIKYNPILYPSYDNHIDQLIQANSDLKNAITYDRVFDVVSDFVFEPGQEYTYMRLATVPLPESPITLCNTWSPTYPTSYFETINDAYSLTLSFVFTGDQKDWVVFSERNDIDSGITITKTGTTIKLEYKIFDPSTGEYETFQQTTLFRPQKLNSVCFSINSITGDGYFGLNGQVVIQFKLSPYQYTIKRILYGDIVISYTKIVDNQISQIEESILHENPHLEKVYINSIYIPKEDLNILGFTLINSIDDLYINLPSGLHNNEDSITYLQSICGNNAYKSTAININIKNLNISNVDVLKSIESEVKSDISLITPVNTNVNQINFQNFK